MSHTSAAQRLVVAGPIESSQVAEELDGLAGVTVLGPVSEGELDWLYSNLQATLLTSKAEGFGLPLVEALQRGCPVLCTDLAVFREVSDGSSGVEFFSAEARDPVIEASASLQRLIEAPRPDPGSLSGRFSWEQTAMTVVSSLRRAALGI